MDINQVKLINIVNAESGSFALNHNASGNSFDFHYDTLLQWLNGIMFGQIKVDEILIRSSIGSELLNLRNK